MNKKNIDCWKNIFPEQSPRSFRTTELAIELARLGHNVTVILPHNLKQKIESKFQNSHSIVFIYYGPLDGRLLKKIKKING